MGCWHEHGHGCGPGHGWPAPRGRCAPDEIDWYDDVNWPLRRRSRGRPGERATREDALETRLDDLQAEIRHIEELLADLRRASSGEGSS